MKKLTNIFLTGAYAENINTNDKTREEAMRRHRLSAIESANRMVLLPPGFRVFISRRRMFVSAMAVSFLSVVAIGMLAAGLNKEDGLQNVTTHESHAKGDSVTTSITTTVPQDISVGELVQSDDARTSMIVNGVPVPVPENGTYSQTITTDDGTAHVNISNDSSMAGTGVSSSTSSSHMNISVNSFTDNVHIKSSP